MIASAWIGFDPREAAAFAVARHTLKKYLTYPVPVRGLVLGDLIARGLYKRRMEWRQSAADGPVMWDVISDAPMSTEHACARFFVPLLAVKGWALFCDGDVMFRQNVVRLFEALEATPKKERKAVYCVHHDHRPANTVKMDGQVQTRYARKNWSSFMVFNCDHEANKALTLELLNTLPGRDLHRFCWLDDSEVGALDQSWNFLVGHTDPEIVPDVVHFTEGVPDMKGYASVPYADEWRERQNEWARGALSLPV